MEKVRGIIGVSLLSFLPVLVIQFISLSNIQYAAILSKSFAVASVMFTLSYMAQKQFVNIYGAIEDNLKADIQFRLVNVLFASLATFITLSSLGLTLSIIIFSICIKLSESVLDYNFGYLNFSQGFSNGTKRFLHLSFLRFLVLVVAAGIGFFLFSENLVMALNLVSLASLGLFFYFINTLRRAYTKISPSISFREYTKRVAILYPFSISSIACAVIMMLPRWLVDLGEPESNLFLISFSIVPIFGVVLNVLFSSLIELAKKNIRKSYFKLLVFIILSNLAFYLSQDWLLPIIGFIWQQDLELSTVIFNSLLTGLVFNSAVLFANYYKFTRPKLEFFTYSLGGVVMYFYFMTTHDILESLIVTSSVIFIASLASITFFNDTLKAVERKK